MFFPLAPRCWGALALCVTLTIAAQADPPAYVLDSPDGKSHCSVWCWEGETVKVETDQNGLRREWERTEADEVFLAVSPSGQVVATTAGELRFYQADSRPIRVIPVLFAPEAAWYSEDGQSLFVLEEERIWEGSVSDWHPKTASWEEIWQNPGAPLPELLWAASRQDRMPPRELLRNWAKSSDYSIRVSALACLARLGEQQAAEKLRRDLPSAYGEGDVWLSAMAITCRAGWEGTFLSLCTQGWAPKEKTFERLGSFGRDWLERQLDGLADDDLMIVLSRYQHPLGPAAVKRLERLARADNLRALIALRDGDYPERDETMTRLLKSFSVPPEHLKYYFMSHSVPESGPYWLELLRTHPHSEDLPRILHSTYRVDLGSDPKAWQEWATRRPGNAYERIERLPDRDSARFLLRGLLGRIETKDLSGPRMVQMVDEPARVLDCQRIETLSGHHRLIPIGPGKPLLLGPEQTTVDRASGRQAWLEAGGIALRELDGRLLPSIPGKFSAESTFEFFGRGRWLVTDEHIIDLSTRQSRKLPRTGRFLFLDGHSGPGFLVSTRLPIWNLPEARLVEAPTTMVACDGQGYVLGNRRELVAYDKSGRALGRLDSAVFEVREVGPGANWAIVGRYERKIGAKTFPPLLWFPGKEPQSIPGLGDHRSLTMLSPDGARMHIIDVEARREEIYEVPQFKRVAQWPWRGSWSQFSSDHRFLSVFQKRDTRIYELERTSSLVPPEGQRLLTELWTGCRLQGGIAVELTPRQYQLRLDQWREQAGSDWALNPVWNRRAPGWPWWWSLPIVAVLATGWYLVARSLRPTGADRRGSKRI